MALNQSASSKINACFFAKMLEGTGGVNSTPTMQNLNNSKSSIDVANSSFLLAMSRQSSPDEIRAASSSSENHRRQKREEMDPPPLRIHYPKYNRDHTNNNISQIMGIEIPTPMSPSSKKTIFPSPSYKKNERSNPRGPYLDRMSGTHAPIDFKDTKGYFNNSSRSFSLSCYIYILHYSMSFV